MLHLKMLGGTMVIAAGSFAAFSLSSYERKKLTVLDAWIDLIFHIRGQIDCYLMPMPEILASGDRALFEACMSPANAADLPEILQISDRIIVIGEGRIIEQGTHRELMSSDGKYKEMFTLQASSYRGTKEAEENG